MSFSLTDRVFSKNISDTCFSRRIAGSAKQPNIHLAHFFSLPSRGLHSDVYSPGLLNH